MRHFLIVNGAQHFDISRCCSTVKTRLEVIKKFDGGSGSSSQKLGVGHHWLQHTTYNPPLLAVPCLERLKPSDESYQSWEKRAICRGASVKASRRKDTEWNCIIWELKHEMRHVSWINFCIRFDVPRVKNAGRRIYFPRNLACRCHPKTLITCRVGIRSSRDGRASRHHC